MNQVLLFKWTEFPFAPKVPVPRPVEFFPLEPVPVKVSFDPPRQMSHTRCSFV